MPRVVIYNCRIFLRLATDCFTTRKEFDTKQSSQVNGVFTQASNVTRLGDFLHFGQLFKACCNNYFAQIAHILGNFCKAVKMFHFSSGISFVDIWRLFTGHTASESPQGTTALVRINWNCDIQLHILNEDTNMASRFATHHCPSPASFWFNFGLLQANLHFLQQINVKNIDLVSGAGY